MSKTEKEILQALKDNGGLSPTELIAEMSGKGRSEPEIHRAMDHMIKRGNVRLTSDRKLRASE